MIKSFIIVAQDNKGNEKMPTRRLTTNTGTPEEPFWMDLGVAWIKKNVKGETFLSALLNTNRTYKNQEGKDVFVNGLVMITENEYARLKDCEARCAFLTSPTEEHPVGIDMAKHPLNGEAEQKAHDEALSEIGF